MAAAGCYEGVKLLTAANAEVEKSTKVPNRRLAVLQEN